MKTQWTDEKLRDELLQIAPAFGSMPTVSHLKEIGRSDVTNQISKRGGWRKWSAAIGFPMKQSDTLTGWEAEDMVQHWLVSLGYTAEKQTTRAHFDFLLNGCIRIDVKGARFAKYGASSGWFYRMGKQITADVVICARMDRNDFYVFPWFRTPSTNLTITSTGKAHEFYRMNLEVIPTMLSARCEEHKFPACTRF